MDYEKKVYHKPASSGTAKAALATGITGAALGLLNGGGGLLGGLGGLAAPARGYGPVAFAAEQAAFQGGYVTEKELTLTSTIGSKDAEIASLRAEKYTDAVVAAAVVPLANRVCEIEKLEAVNAARDHDFRRFVDREFVHQPKASMRESIVTSQQCGCCCCDHRD